MTGWVKVWLVCFLVAGLCGLSACGLEPRIRTHPDPETRLKEMRKALESLPDDNDASETPHKTKGKERTDENSNPISTK